MNKLQAIHRFLVEKRLNYVVIQLLLYSTLIVLDIYLGDSAAKSKLLMILLMFIFTLLVFRYIYFKYHYLFILLLLVLGFSMVFYDTFIVLLIVIDESKKIAEFFLFYGSVVLTALFLFCFLWSFNSAKNKVYKKPNIESQ